jgi:hypothetical protein
MRGVQGHQRTASGRIGQGGGAIRVGDGQGGEEVDRHGEDSDGERRDPERPVLPEFATDQPAEHAQRRKARGVGAAGFAIPGAHAAASGADA